MNWKRVSGITIFFGFFISRLCVAEDVGDFNGIPMNYSECAKTEPMDRTVSNLKCDYSVSADKTNLPKMEKFLQCLSLYPEYGDLAELSCRYVSNDGNPIVPGIVKCVKSDGTNYFPGILDDRPCVLRFYNPDYVFPKNFRECQSRGGAMSQTYSGQETCRITIELCGDDPSSYYCTHVYNRKESEALLDTCRASGGQFVNSLGRFPQCELLFEDQQTGDGIN